MNCLMSNIAHRAEFKLTLEKKVWQEKKYKIKSNHEKKIRKNNASLLQ